MKRVKVLAIVLTLAIMITGAAYALWNEDITVTTQATMGEMKIDIVCGTDIYPLSCMPGLPANMWDGYFEDYMNPITGSIINDGQAIQVTVGDLYPGAKYGLDFTVRNTGTVPFRLAGADFVYGDDGDGLCSELKGSFSFLYVPVNGISQTINVPLTSLASLETALVNACNAANVILYPGDELKGLPWPFFGSVGQDDGTVFMQVAVDEDITGDYLEKAFASFNVVFNWVQCDPVQLGTP